VELVFLEAEVGCRCISFEEYELWGLKKTRFDPAKTEFIALPSLGRLVVLVDAIQGIYFMHGRMDEQLCEKLGSQPATSADDQDALEARSFAKFLWNMARQSGSVSSGCRDHKVRR